MERCQRGSAGERQGEAGRAGRTYGLARAVPAKLKDELIEVPELVSLEKSRVEGGQRRLECVQAVLAHGAHARVELGARDAAGFRERAELPEKHQEAHVGGRVEVQSCAQLLQALHGDEVHVFWVGKSLEERLHCGRRRLFRRGLAFRCRRRLHRCQLHSTDRY